MKLHGPGVPATVRAIQANDREVKEETGTIWHYLVDFNEAGRPTADAGRVWREVTNDELSGKVAVFGTHPVAWVLATFFSRVARHRGTRFFKTEEEALEWIRS